MGRHRKKQLNIATEEENLNIEMGTQERRKAVRGSSEAAGDRDETSSRVLYAQEVPKGTFRLRKNSVGNNYAGIIL